MNLFYDVYALNFICPNKIKNSCNHVIVLGANCLMFSIFFIIIIVYYSHKKI